MMPLSHQIIDSPSSISLSQPFLVKRLALPSLPHPKNSTQKFQKDTKNIMKYYQNFSPNNISYKVPKTLPDQRLVKGNGHRTSKRNTTTLTTKQQLSCLKQKTNALQTSKLTANGAKAWHRLVLPFATETCTSAAKPPHTLLNATSKTLQNRQIFTIIQCLVLTPSKKVITHPFATIGPSNANTTA